MQIFFLLLGAFACSTSVIFIKKSGVDPVLLSGLRLVVATIVLTPVFLRDWRRHQDEFTWGHVRDSAAPGIALALHFITWIAGARMTPAINSTLIVNIVSVVMPLLLWLFVRERLTSRETIATLVAAVGLGILFAADYQVSATHFRGDAICFGSMLMLAIYLALGRRYRHHPTVWLYLVPLYAMSSLLCLAASALTGDWRGIDWQSINWLEETIWVLALGLVPTVIGHSLVNNAMRHLRGQVVSITVMSQFVFAGLLAYPILGEVPEWYFFPASAAIVAGGVLAVSGRADG